MIKYAEIYAINVMPWVIAHFIGCSKENKELIEEERESFRKWLHMNEERNLFFSSQQTAWEAYTEDRAIFVSHFEEDPFSHLDTDETEQEGELVWLKEIIEIFENQAGTRLANQWDSNLNHLLA